MKVLDFKKLVVERLQRFRDDPLSLPSLVYARYGSSRIGLTSAGNILGDRRGNKQFYYAGFQMPDKHKRHQIHSQHRSSLVSVLEFLIHRLDIVSMSSKLIAPSYKRVRNLYNIEIAKHTGLSIRTVQRCIGTLVRSSYIVREPVSRTIVLSKKLFTDLRMDISLNVVTRQLKGLASKARKNQQNDQGNASNPNGPAGSKTTPRSSAPAGADGATKTMHQTYAPEQHSKSKPATGNAALAALRASRRSTGPPDPG